MVSSLFVIRGNDQGARFEVRDQRVRLGRDAGGEIQLHDTEVSRRHAQIVWQGDHAVIFDLGSSNGTFVNGHQVTEHRLESGDHVRLGGTLMLYTAPGKHGKDEFRDTIAIAATHSPDEQSQIVRAISQEEGSRIFQWEAGAPQDFWLAQDRGNLQLIYRTALAVSHTLDIDQLLGRIMDLIFDWVEADRGCIMLVDPQSQQFVPKVRRTRKGSAGGERITISKTILDYVRERNEGVLTSDARRDARWDSTASILQTGVREAICAPMQGRYDMVGAIYFDTSSTAQQALERGGATKFTEDHLKVAIAIAHQAALAVEDTRYYSAMVQAERLAAIGQTVATLSHHVKNILQGIRGGSYLIEMGLDKHDESIVRKGWSIVEKNQTKISALVLDMLTFSKEREPELATADLNQVTADVVELVASRAAELDVQLRWHLAEGLPHFVFDPEGMHRAILNVVTNAVDAAAETEKNAYVEVITRYQPDDAKLTVEITDNGQGIPPEQMEGLFSPFVSFKGGRGTGLGLPVSQKILREHGGQILVDTTPGQGSRFTLELPAVEPDTSPVTQQQERGERREERGEEREESV